MEQQRGFVSLINRFTIAIIGAALITPTSPLKLSVPDPSLDPYIELVPSELFFAPIEPLDMKVPNGNREGAAANLRTDQREVSPEAKPAGAVRLGEPSIQPNRISNPTPTPYTRSRPRIETKGRSDGVVGKVPDGYRVPPR